VCICINLGSGLSEIGCPIIFTWLFRGMTWDDPFSHTPMCCGDNGTSKASVWVEGYWGAVTSPSLSMAMVSPVAYSLQFLGHLGFSRVLGLQLGIRNLARWRLCWNYSGSCRSRPNRASCTNDTVALCRNHTKSWHVMTRLHFVLSHVQFHMGFKLHDVCEFCVRIMAISWLNCPNSFRTWKISSARRWDVLRHSTDVCRVDLKAKVGEIKTCRILPTSLWVIWSNYNILQLKHTKTVYLSCLNSISSISDECRWAANPQVAPSRSVFSNPSCCCPGALAHEFQDSKAAKA